MSEQFTVKKTDCSYGGFWGGLYQAHCIESLRNVTDSKLVTLNTQISKSLRDGDCVDVQVDTLHYSNVEQYIINFFKEGLIHSTSQAICGQSTFAYDKQFSKMPSVETHENCNEIFFWHNAAEDDVLRTVKTKWPEKKPDGIRDKLFWVKSSMEFASIEERASFLIDVSSALLGIPFEIGVLSYLLSVSTHYNRMVDSDWYLSSVEYISSNENFLNMRTKLYSEDGTLVAVGTSTSVPTISGKFKNQTFS